MFAQRITAIACLVSLLAGSPSALVVVAQDSTQPPIVSAANACCDQCNQRPCRCRLRQLISPNRFRVSPPNYGSSVCPPQSAADWMAPTPAMEFDPNAPADQPSTDPSQPSTAPSPAVDPDTFALSSGLGSGFESSAADVATIGDFFGGGAIITGPTWGQVPIVLPSAGGDRRYKLTEHTSPIPTDRMFFDYHFFNNALVDANNNNLNLNRYVFGFEKTLGRGNVSAELRIPLANGLDSTQDQTFNGDVLRATEFGNISLTPKFLLYRDCNYAVSTGMGVIFPSAADAELISQGGTSVVIQNEAYHLQPFFAVQRNLNARTWATLYTQADFAAGSNTVESFDDGGSVFIDEYTDQNLLFIDLSFGRWFHRSDCRHGCIQGVAGIFELHYTTTMNNTDVAVAGSPSNFDPFPPPGGTQMDVITNPFNRLDVINTTLGLRFLCGNNTLFTVAGVAPLRGGEESLFDGEFVFQVSRRR